MQLSACQRYWYDVAHEGPRGWVLYFRPAIFGGRLEVRWGFDSPQHAARAKALLVMEHFVERECCGR
ncbi:MAG: hypothetical protein E6Q97_22645 [Desulfurellales bacterium]|nr:MAG: hypothetical protein E6Q97_22645 [Desulfurellales bacterium]